MVDQARTRALLDRLGEETAHLRRLAAYSAADLLADPDRLAAVKYRLVHGYGRVDDRRVVEILRTRLRDFDDFRTEVARAALG
jgi:hypothetical protein